MLRRILIAASIAALPLLAVGRSAKASPAGSAAVPPGIRLWTSHSDTYRRGERARIFFRTERDAYVTIFRVDTDGRVRVLFPREPNDPNLAHGGETYNVQGLDDRDAFSVDDSPGVGYVFGVASQDPFAYDPLIGNDHWSIQAVANLTDGRIHGDPNASLQDLVQRIEPEGYADYDTHLLPYYVEQRYDYPRFLCYDCHAYTPYAYWNPYSHFCSRFSLFVYYDPFYFYPSYWYPTRYYGGTNVVYVRPRFAGSQYVFKAPGDQSAPSVVFRDRRGVGTAGGMQAPADRGVRGADLGGVGSIPAPTGGRRMVDNGAGVPSGVGVPGERPAVGGAQERGRRFAPSSGPPPVIGPSAGTSKPPLVNSGGGRRFIGEPAAAAAGNPRQVAPGVRTPKENTPETQRPRGVYIDPGSRAEPRPMRQPEQRTPAAAAGRYIPPAQSMEPRSEAQPSPRGEPRYSPPPATRSEPPRAAPRGEPRYSPPPAARSEPPRAAPRGESRPSSRSGSGAPTLIRRRP